ncbi:MAG TPA: hypothetical protein VFJ63_03280 [Candidatus Bathyarchaeia archaeon]|nr:hypothetical protein [Candidatus Bathyarchaeia archaeon]
MLNRTRLPAAGPHADLTLVERFVSLIPVPYPVAAIIWSVLLGSPGLFLVQYFETGTITGLAYSSIPSEILFLCIPVYMYIIPHYMRLKIVATGALIARRLSGGDQDYRRAFGKMTQPMPVLALTIVFGTMVLIGSEYADFVPSPRPWMAFSIIATYLVALGLAAYLWMFATASLGLYRLGSTLRLGPFQEDRMMGSRPIGNLALSLTMGYFGGLFLMILIFSGLFLSPLATSSLIQGVLFGLLLVGVAMFFLPLHSVHSRMKAEKQRLVSEISARYLKLEADASTTRAETSLDDLRSEVAKLTELQRIQVIERKVASLPTWPFDIQVVSKFITVVLSVTAVLVSRIITNFLRI